MELEVTGKQEPDVGLSIGVLGHVPLENVQCIGLEILNTLEVKRRGRGKE